MGFSSPEAAAALPDNAMQSAYSARYSPLSAPSELSLENLKSSSLCSASIATAFHSYLLMNSLSFCSSGMPSVSLSNSRRAFIG